MALPKTFTGGERLFATDLNDNFEALDTAVSGVQSDLSSNLNASSLNSGTVPEARFPSGTIVQVKTLEYTDPVIKSSFANSEDVLILTGLALSITPKFNDSKLLVHTVSSLSGSDSESFSSRVFRKVGTGEFEFNHWNARIVRSQDAVLEYRHAPNGYTSLYLDSPATTDEVTYQVRIFSSGASNGLAVNRALSESDRRSHSYIVVYEVRP